MAQQTNPPADPPKPDETKPADPPKPTGVWTVSYADIPIPAKNVKAKTEEDAVAIYNAWAGIKATKQTPSVGVCEETDNVDLPAEPAK